MSRAIMAREATVKTAAVEVKALTIAGRQVTLSVYRQLKDEPVLDEDTVTLRGVPWGMVNYFWGDCAKAPEHLHVVWQKADQLRRACVYPDPKMAGGWQAKREMAQQLAVSYCARRLIEYKERHGLSITWPAYGSPWIDVGAHDRAFRVLIDGDYRGAVSDFVHWERAKPDRRSERFDRELGKYLPLSDEEYQEKVAAALADHGQVIGKWMLREGVPGLTSDEAHRDLIDQVEQLANFEQRWRDQYAALSELDHLFIAV